MKWTPQEQEWVSMYGLCLVCGAPRKFQVTEPTPGVALASMACTADPTHGRLPSVTRRGRRTGVGRERAG